MVITSADFHRSPTPDLVAELRGLTLPSVFAAAVAAAPSEVALRDRRGERTWHEWQSAADAFACGLKSWGVGRGDVVAVHLPNSWEFLVTHVATALVGAVFLPLHMGCGPAEVRALVDRVRPVVVVLGERPDGTTSRLAGELREHARVLTADGSDADSVSGVLAEFAGLHPPDVPIDPDAPFVLLSSSGTTSARPKICVHTHDGLLSNAAAVAEDREPGVVLSASPFSHLFGLLSVHLSLLGRTCQVVEPCWDPERFTTAARAGVDEVFAVPAQLWDLLALLERDDAEPPRVRSVRTGGAAVPAKLVADLSRVLGAEVRVQWGMSELGAGLVTRVGELAADRDVGRPLAGGRVRVVDEQGQQCAAGGVGELQYLGPSLFRGYYGEPELTAAAFTEDGWLRTGDLAQLGPAGQVFFAGRAAELLNVGGQKFSVLEIEDAVRELPGVRAVAVTGVPDPRLGEYPCLVLVVEPGRRIELDGVVRHLRGLGVAEYKIPLDLRVVAELPTTPTGKISRGRLIDLVLEQAAPVTALGGDSLRLVREVTARVLELPGPGSVAPGTAFRDQGLNSFSAVRLARELAHATGREVPSSAAFDHPTPAALAAFLDGVVPDGPERDQGDLADDQIVLTGMACRLPGGIGSPEELWQALKEGRDLVSEPPGDRGWAMDELFSSEPGEPGRTYVRTGAFLDDIAGFDHEFFGISPREARAMDPQQRLLLEVAWEALENAGIQADSVRGSDTGVFVGMMPGDYGPRLHDSPESFDGTLTIGTTCSIASGRLAYFLGTHGPALSIDTACSSSLVALHLAVRAIERGECDRALVGGVTVMSTPASFVDFSRQRVLSPNGRCRPFAAGADGVGWSEGVVVVVVERLSAALRANRPVLAVVRGSATNQDGASNGLTAPSGPAQERVIRAALRDAGLTPDAVDLVEAHGTGTAVGDPIEANALLAVYRERTSPVLLSSVKSVLGHTQAAAGLVSVMATVLAMRHGEIPATRHVDAPTPAVDWSSGVLSLATDTVAWPATERPRRAGVSSFGLSGTNAHVVLEQGEFAPSTGGAPDSAESPWLISARTGEALRACARQLDIVLGGQPDARSADVAAALLHKRTSFGHRAVILPGGDQRAALAVFATGVPSADVVQGAAVNDGRVVFVFPGQGSQWPGMARDLLATSPEFAASIADCERALAPHVGFSLTEVLTGTDPAALARIEVVQPVLFAVMVSLARLWMHHGVRPAAVVGHSQGEIAAACVAGGLSLEDAAKVVAVRSRLLARLVGKGTTLFVPLRREEVEQLLERWPGRLAIAAANGPRAVVVSGDTDAAAELREKLLTDGIEVKWVADVAAHSAQTEQIRDELCAAIAGLRPRGSSIPLYSATLGDWCDTAICDAAHWYRNLREPVEFEQATRTLMASGHTIFLEASPHPVLAHAVEQTAEDLGESAVVLGTLRRNAGGGRGFLRALATAHAHGLPIDWEGLITGDANAVVLPSYPFQRSRHWLGEAGEHVHARAARRPADLAEMRALVLSAAAAVSGRADVAGLPAEISFSDLGFTSLAAVELRDRLVATLGVRLPSTVVMDHRTPAALAGHLLGRIGATAADPALPDGLEPVYRKLCAEGLTSAAAEMIRQLAGSRTTFTEAAPPVPEAWWHKRGRSDLVLVCLPSVVPSGGVHEYAALAEHLADVDVLSLSLPGFREGEQLPADVGALREALGAAVRETVAGRRFVLCGHSSGGWLAHLLAESASLRPEGLVLLDSPWPAPGFVRDEVPRWLNRFISREHEAGIEEVGIIRLTATGGYLRLLETWRPDAVGVPVLHLSAQEEGQSWHLAHTAARVPGDHFTMMSDHAEDVAELISKWQALLPRSPV